MGDLQYFDMSMDLRSVDCDLGRRRGDLLTDKSMSIDSQNRPLVLKYYMYWHERECDMAILLMEKLVPWDPMSSSWPIW